jgi:hypothetical protein
MLGKIQVRGAFVNVDVDVHVDVFGFLFRSLVCPETAVHAYIHGHVHVNVHGIRRSAERDRAGVQECSAGFE